MIRVLLVVDWVLFSSESIIIFVLNIEFDWDYERFADLSVYRET